MRRAAVAAPLLAVAALCWAITVHRMHGMEMNPAHPGTPLGGLGWFAVVWATMMAAMMLPSFVPMAVAYARGTALFAGGYLLTWVLAGVPAYAVVEGVRAVDPSWLAWNHAGPYVAGAVVVGAALYELTPVKAACLRHCREPALLVRRFGWRGALRAGVEQGGFCVGSSWALMAALFALGVMNVTWMIVVAALIAIEKLLPRAAVAIGVAAVVVAALGLALALAPDQVPALTMPG